jgi:hypothetical protein
MGYSGRDGLVGNPWVLAGGVLYLLEWVAIIWAGIAGVGAQVTRGASTSEVMDSYAGHADAIYSMTGWFAVVLLGRILLFIGLRQALADSGHGHPLLDFAVAASAVSVTLEIASYGLAATAVAPADAGDESLAVLVDQAGAGLNVMISGGLGVAIVCVTYVMWRSGLFSSALVALGAVAGIAAIAAQVATSPSLQALFDILYLFPLVFWGWMLWAGVVCLRARPRHGERATYDARPTPRTEHPGEGQRHASWPHTSLPKAGATATAS